MLQTWTQLAPLIFQPFTQQKEGDPKVYRSEGFGVSSDRRSPLKGHAEKADPVKQN
jgi:hypothetical protein